MANTSATGGYLVPAAAPLSDDALNDFMQAIIVGITALPGAMVRARWQAEPPNIPGHNEDWAAVGITSSRPDTYGYEGDYSASHIPTASHETFDLACSFYGPNAQRSATLLREGLRIGQNREALLLAGMGLVSSTDPQRTPQLLKEKWWNRFDLTVTIKREIRLSYPVLNILSAAGTISSGDISLAFSAEP